MKLESNIIDPYIGQTAEGKKIDFKSKKLIQKKELKVFKFESKILSGNILRTFW